MNNKLSFYQAKLILRKISVEENIKIFLLDENKQQHIKQGIFMIIYNDHFGTCEFFNHYCFIRSHKEKRYIYL